LEKKFSLSEIKARITWAMFRAEVIETALFMIVAIPFWWAVDNLLTH